MKKLLLVLGICALGVLSVGTSFISFIDTAEAAQPRTLAGSETKDWASLADAVGASEDVSVPGAALGDFCLASMSVDIVDMVLDCGVTAAGVATARLQNESAATVDLASGTLRVQVIKVVSTGG